MATNDVWRLTCVGSHSGTEVAMVTLHIRMKTGVGTFDGAAAYIKTNLLTVHATGAPNTFRWDKILGLTANLTPPRSAEYATGFPLNGNEAQDEVAHQVAMVVSEKTAYAGRSYRGRHYMPALNENQMTSGLVSSSVVSSWQTVYDGIVAAIGSGGSNADYEWVVWSKKLDTATPVTQAIVRAIPGVVRKRRVGVGQ